MSAKDRINTIKQMVSNEKKVTVSNLSEVFRVTEETIRRDLEKLEIEGVLTRTYGGAILNENSQMEGVPFYKRANTMLVEKRKIALKVLPLLENKTTMSGDSSSTVMELLKLLKNRKDLTILTNSTEAFNELSKADVYVVSTGGEFNKSSLSLQGRLTKEIIKKYLVDVVVMSCKGLDMENGALDSNENEAEIKKAMLEQASEVILLADHSKFDKKAFVQLADLECIDYLVTDQKPSKEWVQFCEKNSIELIY